MTEHKILSDYELVGLLKLNNQKAFAELYDRYKGLLYVHATRHLKDQEDAKDIIHDIFSNLWQNRASLNIQENLAAYLYQSVRNRIINFQLKNKRADEYANSFQSFLNNFHQADTDHLIREKMLVELIEYEIASLPVKMRTVFEMSRKEGLSHKQISEKLNITEQSVRSHVKGALKILRFRIGFVLLTALITVFYK
ncbi:RNA polymerase sigma-70 factor [Pedobacter aquae]|uniref:RNA polymerase sigma-70 factor n=1 Tax=Pedobacter aquae TaxID=2605747 RepID=A0A5C0VGP2_9SPHI|nr:RNA polymerase sigma-70 factor [Pedobacter aquae]QEK51062.1 RNA polymerase sigma-70 factor [Pedobacter aquae]